jgi:hypothetical protein
MLTILEKHGVNDANFSGFMNDKAQANFNIVKVIFGSGDPNILRANKERTCVFH